MLAASSVNHHASWHGLTVRTLGSELCLLRVIVSPRLVDMWLQALVEVVCAHASVDNRHQNKDNSDDGEECQRSPRGEVITELGRLVHPHQLEKEVCQPAEVEKLREVSQSRPIGVQENIQ